MAGVLHGSARTTPRVRAELQASQEATRVLAARYGLNPKTIQKWRKRTTTADQPMGPTRPRSTVLTEIEEAIVVEFRRRTLLPPLLNRPHPPHSQAHRDFGAAVRALGSKKGLARFEARGPDTAGDDARQSSTPMGPRAWSTASRLA